jgi:hypothetical protein
MNQSITRQGGPAEKLIVFLQVSILGLIIHADKLNPQLDGDLGIEIRTVDGVVGVASYDVIFQRLQVGVMIPVLHDGSVTSVEQVVLPGEVYIDELFKYRPTDHPTPGGQEYPPHEPLRGGGSQIHLPGHQLGTENTPQGLPGSVLTIFIDQVHLQGDEYRGSLWGYKFGNVLTNGFKAQGSGAWEPPVPVGDPRLVKEAVQVQFNHSRPLLQDLDNLVSRIPTRTYLTILKETVVRSRDVIFGKHSF